ncbi:MAG TPA: hypothetical protein PLJ69_08915 [Methanothrix sp.]|nr:hypothetical protein [Methanothrix sp.]HPY73038.1 hypothetical protein [Methanothrix sp.]HQA63047.1 hypothetical protein [Methanothrix sp.]
MILIPYLPTLIGSFVGVFLAFALNRAYDRYVNRKKRAAYRGQILSEIKHCIEILERDRLELLPTDLWDSMKNSGILILFSQKDELIQLTRMYHNIQDYNIRVADLHLVGYRWDRLEREDGRRLPIMKIKRILNDRKEIRSGLGGILIKTPKVDGDTPIP